MEFWILSLAATVGALVGAGVMRLYAVGRTAALDAERSLLRERVVDLEAALGADSETAQALRPLAEALTRVEGQVAVLERDRLDQFGTVRTILNRVESETASLGRQTQSLAGSLNAANVRGAWGEVQLRRVLEHAGMLARCDFDEQVTAISRHGNRVRPDVVVHLPGGKSLVVDAKAPMSAFLQAQGEDVEPAERTNLLGEHAKALDGHVRQLAAKDYWSAFTTTPEMVVCFVPSEAMLSSALAAAPGMHEAAMARRVVLVGPGSLLALLRSVAFTWQQDALSTSARELAVVGRDLYDRLSMLGTHVNAMGTSLRRSVETYNQLVGTLESRVLVSARRMHALGVSEQLMAETPVVDAVPRVLTAVELLDALSADDAREELDFGLNLPGSRASPRQRDAAS